MANVYTKDTSSLGDFATQKAPSGSKLAIDVKKTVSFVIFTEKQDSV